MALAGNWQDLPDERVRDWREPEDGRWQDPTDDEYSRSRRPPEPDGWIPAHEVADYRFSR
jgi:hypothetical protein